MQSSRNSATDSETERQRHASGEVALARREYGWLGTFAAMASPCEVHVEGADRDRADRVLDAVAAEAWRVEQKYSRYLDGNIVSRINATDGAAIEVDEETAGLLDYADTLFRLSDGSFDITSGVLRRAWRFDGGSSVPAKAEVDALMKKVGWRRVRWQRPDITLEPGMEVDLGGIGKEYAVDRAAAIAERLWPRCLLNFGGDLRAIRPGVDRGGWTVGIEGLCADSVPARRIRLARGGIATSGDSKRFLIRGGKRYGHILDPTTGYPVEGAPRSVTVLAPTCMEAGMLATFAMLQGREAESFLEAQECRYWVLR
jgi:thiamine biosynthesis lipoprotein